MALRQEGRSILDAINSEVKRLRIRVGGTDRTKRTLYDPAVTDGQTLVGVEDPRTEKVADVQRALRAAGS